MNKQNNNEHETELRERKKGRVNKKNKKMKVSGKNVLKLAKIISNKAVK